MSAAPDEDVFSIELEAGTLATVTLNRNPLPFDAASGGDNPNLVGVTAVRLIGPDGQTGTRRLSKKSLQSKCLLAAPILLVLMILA